MNRCERCRYGGGKHLEGCPLDTSAGLAQYALDGRMIIWQQGYKDGRAGKRKPDVVGATYLLGWLQGDAAADEAANG